MLAAPAKKKPSPAPQLPKLHLEDAYFNGELVKLQQVALEKGQKPEIIGPWNFGPRVSPKPSDKRPNLYIVVPGSLHKVEDHPEFNHTEILSYAPDDAKEFDVYWAVVLDPTLDEQFTAEPQLLLAAQATFKPDDDFTFDKIPAAPFMRDILKITDLDWLKKYRRPNGSLPRVAIITGHFAVRFSTEKTEEQPEEKTAEQPRAEQ